MTTLPDDMGEFLRDFKELLEKFLDKVPQQKPSDGPPGFTRQDFDRAIEERERDQQMREVLEHLRAIREFVEVMAERTDG